MTKLYLDLFIWCVVISFGKGYPQNPCGPNEEMQCVRSCPPEFTCKTRHLRINCLAVLEHCGHKCVCKEGYYRNILGACITNEECDQCSGDNEFFACGSECDSECSTLSTQNRINCSITNINCNNKCYCNDGYARDDNNNCILVEKCNLV